MVTRLYLCNGIKLYIMKPVINICSDEELREAAEQWCKLVHNKIKKDQVNAFMMGAKIAIANNGWVPSFKDEARQLTVDRFTNLTDGLVLPDTTPGKVVDYYQNLLDRKDYDNTTIKEEVSNIEKNFREEQIKEDTAFLKEGFLEFKRRLNGL